MNERNWKDLINCDCADKEKMIAAAKEKLRWYTYEASEEEFDTEAVDALVKFLRDAEPELGKDLEKEKDDVMRVQKRCVIEWSRGKIAVAVVMGILALTLVSAIVGNSLGTALAWEDGGFFRWLQRDKEGQTMITSPEDLGVNNGGITRYEYLEDVPEEYREFLVKPEDIRSLVQSKIKAIEVEEMEAFQCVSTFFEWKGKMDIKLGVTIFEKEISVARDSYDDFEYKYTNDIYNRKFDIYIKENVKDIQEYAIFCYEKNKRYFILGKCDLKIMEIILNEYIQWLLNN